MSEFRFEVAPSSPAAGATTEPQLRRLSISHLLLWMAGTAVALAFFRSQLVAGANEVLEPDERLTRLIEQAYVFALAPFIGAALASLPLVAWDLGTGRKSFPRQPGHWLLVVHGVGFLATMVAILLISTTYDLYEFVDLTWDISFREIIQLTPTFLVSLFPTILIPGRRWRWMFSLMTAGYLLAAGFYAGRLIFGHDELYQVGTSFLWILQTMSIFALVVCVLGDRQASIPRDFLHTTGIVVRFAIVLLGWVLPWVMFLLRG